MKTRKTDTALDKLTLPILEKLRTRQITGREVAAQLGITETYLSRLLAEGRLKRIPGQVSLQRRLQSDLAATRTKFRSDLAKKVVSGKLTVAQAAEQAGCNERTMWRYVSARRDHLASEGDK